MLIITRRMSEPIVEWVGSSCGEHGAYTFYKGFKLTANGESRKYLLGDFYFIRNSKDRPICIAEFQLLWHDANTDDQLASARLYFRPESIPGGRQSYHGKDELLYTDEKVVINCKDMMNLEYEGIGWSYGIKAISELNLQEVPSPGNSSEDTKRFRLLKRKSKAKKMMPKERAKMIILSFPAYCRFKSLMKKLSCGLILTKMAMEAFGGIIQCNDSTWVSFSRESFHYPGLAKLDMFSHNKAPVLKGRPRKKKASKPSVCKEETKEKHSSAVDAVHRQRSNDADSSDDNQTDTSETSSIGGQELPCPPKLVSTVKEEPVRPPEMSTGVIRSVKHASEFDSKPLPIPPIPKLVKIEPKDPDATHFRNQTKSGAPLVYTTQTADYAPEKSIPIRVSLSGSVISTSQYRDDGRTHVSRATLTHNVGKCEQVPVDKVDCPASASTTLVSRASTITTYNNIQPRMSTIVSTTLATQGEVTANLMTSELSRPGDELSTEQPLKRRRGRPPGKSKKSSKVAEMQNIAPKRETPLLEVDDGVQVKIEDSGEQMYTEHGIVVEDEEYSPEDSPEPQDGKESEFMKSLKIFMRKRGSPIEKIPALGFRKINLFKMFEVTQSLGGYDQVTNKRLWRRVYSQVGGTPSITSAATNSRRHYEKLLLPYERYLRGEDYTLDLKFSESPSPKADGLMSPQRDQNGNVVSENESVVVALNQQENQAEPLSSHLTSVNMLTRPTAVVSHVMQLSKQDNRLQPPAASVMNQQNELFKSAISRGAPLSQQNRTTNPAVVRVMSSQQERQTKVAVSSITSIVAQNKQTTMSALSANQQDRGLVPAAVHTKPAVTGVSHQSQQSRRSVVSHSNTQRLYDKAVDHSNDPKVEYVTKASRDSPSVLCSSNFEKLSARYPGSIQFDSQSIRHSTRPGVITGTGTSERVCSSTPDLLRGEKKAYIVELSEDHPGLYVPQNGAKNEPRTAKSEFERNQKYVSHFDHVTDFRRPRDFHSSVSGGRISEETHDVRKRARGTGDEVILTNVVPSKMSRTHSPIPRDEGFMFSVPVFQPSHYPHGGFELYDLPNTTFPVRASSRIFMPPHQVFPGTGHPAFSPYTPHIIATIGTDPSTLYQLPIPNYYPQELGYPIDGVQLLHN